MHDRQAHLAPVTALEWILRIALCGEFLGHGWFAFVGDGHFVTLLVNATPVPIAYAPSVLRVIGIVDFAIAALALARPARPVLLYAAAWGLATALARPVAGLEVWAFVERLPNAGVPLALFAVRYPEAIRSLATRSGRRRAAPAMRSTPLPAPLPHSR